jgi:hypothetical protein
MTLELVHKIDADGEWYHIRKNGKPEKSFSVTDENREDKLKEAKEYYNRLKVPTQETIILTETI